MTATRDVAWRATIDAGRLVPRASRIGTLDAHSCCVEVEHSLLEPVVDEQFIWRLSTPRPNWTIPFHPEPPKKGPGRAQEKEGPFCEERALVETVKLTEHKDFGSGSESDVTFLTQPRK